MDIKKSVFTAKDENGNLREYEIIFKFASDETKKNYVVYTDNILTDGALNVYASSFDPTGKVKNLLPIETEKEWNTIEAFLSKLEGMKNEEK